MENDRQRNVNLMDLFILILKHKVMIFSVVVLVTASSIVYFYLLRGGLSASPSPHATPLYFSECVIEPDGVSADKLKATLTSRELTRYLIETNSLMPVIKELLLNEGDRTKNPADRFHQNEIQDQLLKQLGYKSESGVIKLTFISASAEYPAKILNLYLLSLSDAFRKKSLLVIEPKRKALQRQLLYETDPVLKTKLSERIIQLIEIEKMAKNAAFYGFDVIDPPSPSRMLSDPQQILGNTKPNYFVIVLLCMLASFMLAVFLAFCIEKLQTAKSEDPERYEQLKKYLHLRAK